MKTRTRASGAWLALVLAASLGALACGASPDAEAIARWQQAQDFSNLAGLVATPSASAELRVRAALALVAAGPLRGRPIGTHVLLRTLRGLEPAARQAVVAGLVPALATELGKPPPGAGADDPSLADEYAAWLLLADDPAGTGSLVADAAARTTLGDALADWAVADYDRRSDGSRMVALERVFELLGPSAIAKLPALVTPTFRGVAAVSKHVGAKGDDATKEALAKRLVALARELDTPAWREARAPEIADAAARAGTPTTPEALEQMLAVVLSETTDAVYRALKSLGGASVVDYLLEVASDSGRAEPVRKTALAALEGQMASDAARQRLLALAASDAPAGVLDQVFARIGEQPRASVASALYAMIVPGQPWKRRRAVVATLLKLSVAEQLDEVMSELGQRVSSDFALPEALTYGALLADRAGPETETRLQGYVRKGPFVTRASALGYYAAFGTRTDRPKLAAFEQDAEKVPPCDPASDCHWSCDVQGEQKPITNLGEFVRFCVEPAMDRDAAPPRSPNAEAARIEAELAALDAATVGALGDVGSSPAADGRLGDIGSSSTGVRGPRGSVSAGASQSGGNVANASPVVARLRGAFRRCYESGLATHPDLAGSLTLIVKVGPNGEIRSVTTEGGTSLQPIVGCLKGVVNGAAFAPPEGAAEAVIRIPLTLTKQ